MSLLVFAGFAAFYYRRQLVYMHLFQQDEYDNPRFLKGLWARHLFDRKGSVAVVAGALVAMLPLVPSLAGDVVIAVALAGLSLRETDPRATGKKKLVMTQRARRIYWVAVACMVPAAAAFALWAPRLALVFLVQAIPLFLVVANLILSPFEKRVQRKYWVEAHDKLLRLKPLVIGVTGSYGKSTVKHILGHILSNVDNALVTPGSINTPMGIARIVREKLDRQHKFFVVEMGAYGPGSIARLCELAPPQHGIITAIGPAHYERFKSLDAVARTKFELGQAVHAAGGRLIVADTCCQQDAAAEFCAAHPETVVLSGKGDGNACRIVSTSQTVNGTEVTLEWQGATYDIVAPIHGPHQAHNISLAFAAACTLGIPAQTVVLALKSVPQVAHRLEVRRNSDGVIMIDDAYNSNPEGFASAMELLSVLVPAVGRRILVTPGIVELGAIHDEVHGRLGAAAAQWVDVLVPVLPGRIESFVSAFRHNAADKMVVPCASFADASQWMAANLRAGDVVLLENDLPDLYEAVIKL